MSKIKTLISTLKKTNSGVEIDFVRKLASSDQDLLKKKLEESGLSVDERGVTLKVPLDLVLKLVSESSESPAVRRLLTNILEESDLDKESDDTEV